MTRITQLRKLIENVQRLIIHLPYFFPEDVGKDLHQAQILLTEMGRKTEQNYENLFLELYPALFSQLRAWISNAQRELNSDRLDTTWQQSAKKFEEAITGHLRKIARDDIELPPIQKDLWEPFIAYRNGLLLGAIPNQQAEPIMFDCAAALKIQVDRVNGTGLLALTIGDDVKPPFSFLLYLISIETIETVLSCTTRVFTNYIQALTDSIREELHSDLGTEFYRALGRQQNYLLLSLWQVNLNELLQRIPRDNSWQRTLALQRLLSTQKPAILTQLISQQTHINALIALRGAWRSFLLSNTEGSPTEFLAHLTAQETRVRQSIAETENTLQASNTLVRWAVKTLNYFLSNAHAQVAELAAHTYKKIAPLPQQEENNKPLTESQLRIIRFLGPPLLTIDLAINYQLGIPPWQMLNQVSQMMLPSLHQFTALSLACNQNERFAVEHLPTLNRVLTVLINASIYCAAAGLSFPNLYWLGYSYMIVELVQACIKPLVQQASSYLLAEKHQTLPYILPNAIAEYVTTTGGVFFLLRGTQLILDGMKIPPAQDLLGNREQCLEYHEECLKAAITTVEKAAKIHFLPTATLDDVYAWRKPLLMKGHPDKGGTNKLTGLLTEAFSRLRELNSTFPPPPKDLARNEF